MVSVSKQHIIMYNEYIFDASMIGFRLGQISCLGKEM